MPEVVVPEIKSVVKRRTPQELQAYHLEQAKLAGARIEAKLKSRLEVMAKDCSDLAVQIGDKGRAAQVGQAGTLLAQAAASIKLPQ